jgi:hypothetical protein
MTCTNGIFSFVHHPCNPCRTNDGKRLKENHSCKWMHVWCFSIRAFSVQACSPAQPSLTPLARPIRRPANLSPGPAPSFLRLALLSLAGKEHRSVGRCSCASHPRRLEPMNRCPVSAPQKEHVT